MSTTVYMKLLEQTPGKYDRGMRIITLGRIDRIKQQIAESCVSEGDLVLEIGCGTGKLPALLAQRGCQVKGIDVSLPMLEEARKNAPSADFAHMTAVQIDELKESSFDCVIGTLVLSELSEDELDHVLRVAKPLLTPGGRLVIADEIVPQNWWQRVVFYLIRWPLAALTFLVTQNTTHALRSFEDRLQRVGYRVRSRQDYLLGSLSLIVAESV